MLARAAAVSTDDRQLAAAKQALRASTRAALRALPARDRDVRSHAACTAVVAAPWFAPARAVFAFVSLPFEIDTTPLLQAVLAAGKQLVLPRAVAPGQLEPVVVADLSDLQPGAFGVREPRAGPGVAFSPSDVALVPGLAFDRSGGRLGRGGGYFDRWLAAQPDLLTCGLAFALQVVACVPMQAHDHRVRWLATENGVVEARA